MADRSHHRLSAAHLDDLAIVILTTPPGSDPTATHPELDEDTRARLRTRLKLISRHDWPANMREDPLIRRGYTLRQCFRLMTALLLLDAHVPPSIAIPIARSNELLFLRAIVSRLTSEKPSGASDALVVVLLGHLWEWVDVTAATAADPLRVRPIARGDLSTLWASDHDFGPAGQRLVLDIGGAGRTMWRWLQARGVMPEDALTDLLAEIERVSAEPDYQPVRQRTKRR
ncbi:hypothetical protein DAH66_14080 [Sphingomonas koreensis]|uniref:Uncharacterized protein n=1 Tax=Sphingomonas koreensis TaxID=93064 RepID=A0A430G1R3_9SPHN|nr:hypothetical protein [Sphingomonas koreensis]RSY81994.1 hypothetical protein DAH66_14080 [Sphingomonas koreensis]